jgi:hypothetical protein
VSHDGGGGGLATTLDQAGFVNISADVAVISRPSWSFRDLSGAAPSPSAAGRRHAVGPQDRLLTRLH